MRCGRAPLSAILDGGNTSIFAKGKKANESLSV
jgi:hypothetical protein